MGKRAVVKEKVRNDSSPQVKQRKLARMQKKVDELNKRYPNNSYAVKESNKLTYILRDRSKGRKPHKTKADKFQR